MARSKQGVLLLSSRFLRASCYLLGLVTAGLWGLGMARRARRRGDPAFMVHARQALLLNWGWLIGNSAWLMAAAGLEFSRVSRGQAGSAVLGESFLDIFGVAFFSIAGINLLLAALALVNHGIVLPFLRSKRALGRVSTASMEPYLTHAEYGALAYVIGSLTWGIGSLLYLWYARRRGLLAAAKHAKRATIINLLLGGLLAGLPFVWFAAEFVSLALAPGEGEPLPNTSSTVLLVCLMLIPSVWAFQWCLVLRLFWRD